MLCYKDKWFCGDWLECVKGSWCGRSATPTVVAHAEEIGLPIEYRVDPECMVKKPERPVRRW